MRILRRDRSQEEFQKSLEGSSRGPRRLRPNTIERNISRWDRVVGHMSRFGCVLAGLSVISMALLVFAEIVSRNLFGISLYIADEYSGYLLVAALFLGMPYAFRTGGLIRVDLFYGRISGDVKHWVDILLCGISLAYVLVLLRYVSLFVLETYHFQVTSTYASKTPLFIPQLSMIFGLTFLAIELVSELVKKMFRLPKHALETK